MSEGASLCDPQRPDLITPARIEHLLDELIQDGEWWRQGRLTSIFIYRVSYLNGILIRHLTKQGTA